MSKEDTLRTLFTTNQIGLFALQKPQGNKHCVVYKRISSVPLYAHNRKIGEKCRFQFDCYSDSYGGVRGLAESVKGLLELNDGDFVIGWLVNDVDVKEVDTNLFRVILEFFLW